jgi:hypothetical protein
MDVSQEYHAGHGRHSQFSRFTGRVRDTMSMKRASSVSRTQHTRALSQADMASDQTSSISTVARRTSGIRYTDRMMQMMFSSSRLSSTATNINDLPVEILQSIFLELDFFVLLRIRRVCKLWNSSIPGDSPLLAEDLFLKPSHNLHAYSFTSNVFQFDFEIHARGPHEENQYLRSQPTFIDGLSMTRRCIGLIRTSEEIIFHPIVANFNHYVQGDASGRSKLALVQGTSTEPLNWKNHLVSMPPLTELRISQTMGGKAHIMCVLRAKDGIKLGAVIDTLLGFGKREDGSG